MCTAISEGSRLLKNGRLDEIQIPPIAGPFPSRHRIRRNLGLLDTSAPLDFWVVSAILQVRCWMSREIMSLNEKALEILHDHLILGHKVSTVAKAHGVTVGYIYMLLRSAPGIKWMLNNISPAQAGLNLRVVSALNDRLDTNIQSISTADLIRILVATTPKEIPTTSADTLREEAEKMADENGLEGQMRERFIDSVLGGMRAA